MSSPTINLQKDLEAWYEFSEAEFDNQRGVIRDKSGYGKHGEANGGPTVGVEGPSSFEAANFDGSDDYFHSTIPFEAGTPYTLAIAYNPDDTSSDNKGQMRFKAGGIHFIHGSNRGGGEINFGFDDDGSGALGIFTTSVAERSGQWTVGVARVIPSESRLQALAFDGHEVLGFLNTTSWDGTYDETSDDDLDVGRALTYGPEFHNGQVAFAGAWSRVLSWAEIRYITDLTGPQRSLL